MESAVTFSVGSIGELLEKLQIVSTECSRIKGVRKQVVFLREELASMHALLLKLAAKEEEGAVDIQAKTWARDVREMAYDVEDCVDAFSVSLRLARVGGCEQGRGGGRIKSFFLMCAEFLRTIRISHDFAPRISELKARVVEVGERRVRYDFGDPDCSNNASLSIDPRLPGLFAEDDEIVGLDGPAEELVSWMLSRGESLSVLSIVGSGGLGKTTIASRVYRMIGQDSCSGAFVSVSQRPDMKKVLSDFALQLLPDVVKEDIYSCDGSEVTTRIREYLSDRRYIVVIDDLWSIPAWHVLKAAFPSNMCGSRILVTTRIVDVAESSASKTGRIYKLQPLDLHQSRILFLKRCECFFEDVVNNILEKCGGLPLAIICISGLLASKPVVKEEWLKVIKLFGSQINKYKHLDRLFVIIRMSYNELPLQLKTCLLYLSLYPEDYLIERDSLVSKWIAEGFICGEQGQSAQDIAQQCFMELINRNLVQPKDIGFDGQARLCKLHDIIFELLVSIALEENFFTRIGDKHVGAALYPIRRLSIQNSEPIMGVDLSHVRSLTAFGTFKYVPSLANFQVVRVLDFERCKGVEEYDFSGIEEQKHLAFLSLRDTSVPRLPAGVVNLLELRTLDLRGTQIVQLPDLIVNLTKLERLLVGDYAYGKTHIPEGIWKMRNLEVLSHFDVIHSTTVAVENLSLLTNLMDVAIQFDAGGTNRRHEEILKYTLGRLRLQSIWITSRDSSPLNFLNSWSPLPFPLRRFRMTTNFFFMEMPAWISPALTNLTYLNLNLAEVTQGDIDLLASLEALVSLDLWFEAEPTVCLVVRGGFRTLKILNYIRRPYITRGAGYLVFESGAQRLENIDVPLCVSIAKEYRFSLGLKNLPSLKVATVIISTRAVSSEDINAADTAVRNEATIHSNHPRLTIMKDLGDNS